MSKADYALQQPYPVQQPQQQPGGVYYNPGQPPMYPGLPPPQPTVVVVQSPPAPQSFVCHFVLSCFVIWCCGWLIGLIAFILAVVAQSKAATEPKSADTLGKVSLAVSSIGAIIGVIIIIVIIVRSLVFTNNLAEAIASCKYIVKDECYKTRELTSLLTCPKNGFYHESYCYYE